MGLSGIKRTVLVAAMLLAAAPVDSAAAQAEVSPPVQVVGPGTATLKEAEPLTVFDFVNQGPSQTLLAVAAEPPSVTMSFDGDAPACPSATPETAVPISTKREIPPGGLARLRVQACGELKGATQAISVWGEAGGALSAVTVQLGEAEPTASVAPLEAVELNVSAATKEASGKYCLPGMATGTVGFVRRNTTIATVVLDPLATPKGQPDACPATTSQSKLSVKLDGKPGAYTGKIDSNGSADGGVVSLAVNARAGRKVFWAWLFLGMAIATIIGWWTRSGRDWGFVDQVEADLRAKVWLGQQTILGELDHLYTASSAKWVVVTSKGSKESHLAMDNELSEYRGDGSWWRRFTDDPGAERLSGGPLLTTVRTSAKTYLDTLDVAFTLIDWRRTTGAIPSPTRLVVDRALTGGVLPASTAIATLKEDADAAHALVGKFEDLRRSAEDIASDGMRIGRTDVVSAANALVEKLWSADLEDEAVDTKLKTSLAELTKRLGQTDQQSGRTGRRYDQRIMDSVDWWYVPVRQIYGALVELDAPERAAAVRRRNVTWELIVAALGLVIAGVSAYAALYAPNLAWGSDTDILAAVTWAATAGAAVQVARHFSTRLPA